MAGESSETFISREDIGRAWLQRHSPAAKFTDYVYEAGMAEIVPTGVTRTNEGGQVVEILDIHPTAVPGGAAGLQKLMDDVGWDVKLTARTG